ncbi:MAG TPA: hypothetical protein VLA77_01825 [Candidatus Saccharimonadales bacterium]|nr:hypothetical protein [Candidatus Saccharimonadales bacterium]
MPATIFLAGIGVALFALAFLTKRSFGVLGLALAAGSLISANFANIVTTLLESNGVSVQFIPLSTLVELLLVITPAIILLVSGPTYSAMWMRIIGSLAFAVLALVFLLQPLGEALNLDGPSLQTYQWFSLNQSIIIVIGLILAVADTLFVRGNKPAKKHGH